MAHIWSGDRIAGTSNADASFTMSRPLLGAFSLSFHLVRADVDIPWMYAGVDTLELTDGTDPVTVTFDEISGDKTDLATAATMLLNINDSITAAPPAAYACTSVTYVAGTDTWDLVFDTAVIIDWTASTSAGAFMSAGVTASLAAHSLPALNGTSRPDFMDVFIPQINESMIASRIPEVTMSIPLQDGPTRIKTRFNFTHHLEVRWSQLYAPGVVCPMTNQWHLQFDQL